jgi:hypothetical protein
MNTCTETGGRRIDALLWNEALPPVETAAVRAACGDLAGFVWETGRSD